MHASGGACGGVAGGFSQSPAGGGEQPDRYGAEEHSFGGGDAVAGWADVDSWAFADFHHRRPH